MSLEDAEIFANQVKIRTGRYPVLYTNGWGTPRLAPTTFYCYFAPKWFSDDGLGLVLVFTGTDRNDSWNTVGGRFLPAEP